MEHLKERSKREGDWKTCGKDIYDLELDRHVLVFIRACMTTGLLDGKSSKEICLQTLAVQEIRGWSTRRGGELKLFVAVVQCRTCNLYSLPQMPDGAGLIGAARQARR